MNKKNVTISLGIATIVGVSIVTQSNIDFAALSEQSAYKIIKNLGHTEISEKMGGLITDYSNYKKEKESIGKEDYKDYQDDALYIADLETDKAVVERIEKEIEKENLEDKEGIPSTEAVEISPIEYIGEIPGPSNEKKSTDTYFSEDPAILTSSHYSSPVGISNIPSSESRSQNTTETVTVKADTKSDKNKTAAKPSVNNTVKISGQAVSDTKDAKKAVENKKTESDSEIVQETEKEEHSSDKKTDTTKETEKESKEEKKQLPAESSKDTNEKEAVKKEDEAIESHKPENNTDIENKEVSTEENIEADVEKHSLEKNEIDEKEEPQKEYKVIQDVYIRKEKDKLSENLGTLVKDEKISGTIDSGWLKFEYKDQIAYVGLRFVEETAALVDESKGYDSAIMDAEEDSSIVTAENLVEEDISDNTEMNETDISPSVENTSLLQDAAALTEYSELDADFIQALYKNHFDIQLDLEITVLDKMGYQVSKENIKEGDLLFFEFENKEETVGIYAGNNKFIHISEVDGSIIESDIQSEDYNKTFVTARRILN